jgi:glutamate--cysteine ligase
MDDLLEPLHEAIKPPSAFRVGAEAEKFGVSARSFTPVDYAGERGVVRVMRALVSDHGWAVSGGSDPLLALEKDGASVTLEPGAQLELSGAPLASLHQVADQIHQHLAELALVSRKLEEETGEGVVWLGMGFHPTARQEDLSWVPKPRYAVMRRYLPARGEHGLDMMRRTATVQANFDYESEEGAMRTLQLGLRMSPFFTAMFANSPFVEGKAFGGKSYRALVWLDVDPDRQGLLPTVLAGSRRFSDYVEWALDAPMFLLLRDGAVVENTGQSFRSFLRHGFGAHTPTMDDWVTHLNSLFPEVRLKRTIEVRGGDSLPSELVVAPAAFHCGVLYDPVSMAEAEKIVEGFTCEELSALRPRVAMEGLAAEFRGRQVGDVAEALVEVARSGLARRAIRRSDGRDESVYLEPLVRRLERRICPADDLLAAYERHGGGEPAVRAAALEVAKL